MPQVIGADGIRMMSAGTRGAVSYVLDGIESAAGVWSLRKLRAAYSGYCVKLRRSSDNATSDFGFVGGLLDTSAISTWLSGATPYVHTWYDQSGNGYNATQTTTGYQPLFVASGENSKPIIRPDGSDDYMVVAHDTGLNFTNMTAISAWKYTTWDTSNYETVAVKSTSFSWSDGYGMGGVASAGYIGFWADDYSGGRSYQATYTNFASFTILSGTYDGSGTEAFEDGVSIDTAASAGGIGSPTGDLLFFAATTSGDGHLDGDVGEIILFDAVLSVTDHNTIGNDVADYFGLTWTTIT